MRRFIQPFMGSSLLRESVEKSLYESRVELAARLAALKEFGNLTLTRDEIEGIRISAARYVALAHHYRAAPRSAFGRAR